MRIHTLLVVGLEVANAAIQTGVTCTNNNCPCLETTYSYESSTASARSITGEHPDMGQCPNEYGNSYGRWCHCADHFPKLEETDSFIKVTQDCRGNTIDETVSGEWWKHNPSYTGVNFRGKLNSNYHFSPEPMSKDNAKAYCKSRGFGDFVHLHCPNGTNENNWLWFHHPWQPFQVEPIYFDQTTQQNVSWNPIGMILGITRGRDFDNFDYWCDENLYPVSDYWNWVWTEPKMMIRNNRVFANHIMQHLQNPGWYNTAKCNTQGYTELDDDGNVIEYKGCEGEGPYSVADGNAGEDYLFHFICEMNCDIRAVIKN